MKTAQERHLLAEVEKRGIVVEFFHLRAGAEFVEAKGGETICHLKSDAGKDAVLLSEGIATCYYKDNFDKSIGRVVSLGRALKAYDG